MPGQDSFLDIMAGDPPVDPYTLSPKELRPLVNKDQARMPQGDPGQPFVPPSAPPVAAARDAGPPRSLERAASIGWDILTGIASIPERAFGASENRRTGGPYDPGPILEGAGMAMTGGLASPLKPGSVEVGSGFRVGGKVEELPDLPFLPRAANMNAQKITGAEMEAAHPPLDIKERTIRNYWHVLGPDEVIHSEPVWGGASILAAEKGISESEAFSELANAMWQRQGANRYISPEQAKTFLRIERAKSQGIGPVQ